MTAGSAPPPPSTPERNRLSRQTWAAIAVGVVVVLGLLIVLIAVLVDDDDETVSSGSTTTSTTQQSTTVTTGQPTTDTTGPTTSVESPTSTTGTTSPADLDTAVWPTAGGSVRYDDPVEAAAGFATDFVGFTDPVVGQFQQGDARSGEVEVRPTANGPVTTVFVRQLGTDDTWWVLGAITASIQPSEPPAEISSPVTLRGTSTAFEATVGVEIRQDDRDEPLGKGFVMGGANGEMGPFESDLAFSAPTADSGTIVFTTESMENGGVWEATVIRVHFRR